MHEKLKPLIKERDIKARVAELAAAAKSFCEGGDTCVVWLKEGARFFAEDFVGALGVSVDSVGIKVSSYGMALESSGDVKISGDISSVKSKKILLIDDILETGNTLDAVRAALKAGGAEEIKMCVLLQKEGCLCKNVSADFVGFKIPKLFVVGYGLDKQGGLRELRDICYLERA